MISWLLGNLPNIVVLALVGGAFFLALRKIVRDKKAGKSCCGGSCGGCSGNCAGCGSCRSAAGKAR